MGSGVGSDVGKAKRFSGLLSYTAIFTSDLQKVGDFFQSAASQFSSRFSSLMFSNSSTV
jgi:hypothetical protein